MAVQETQSNEEAAEVTPKISLQVEVKQPGTCERHVIVTIPREEIDRYMSKALDDLAPKAQVPGFRQGKAPRSLVEKRFREQVIDQVKGSLLMDSMTQVTEEQKFAAISEPKFDIEAIKIPDEGPLIFEFDLEVRPDFALPSWEGLSLERPTHEYSEEDIDRHMVSVLARYAQIEDKEGPVAPGDIVDLAVCVRRGDSVLVEFTAEKVAVKPKLSFRDTRIDQFDKLLTDARLGETRQVKTTVSQEAEREELRGQEVDVSLTVQKIQRTELPKLTHAFLDRIGGFEDEDELRDTVRKELERQLRYHQQRRIREQITTQLTKGANWELPPGLLRGQFQRELDRSVMELQSSGFSEEVIRAHQNEIRRNSLNATARALKEHFILERLAEDQQIDAEPSDFDAQIMLIAAQRGQNPRQVRAQYEKRGQIDALRNQIVERKVIDLITSKAHFSEVPIQLKADDEFAVDRSICSSEEKAIPEAQHAGESEGLRQPAMRN